MAVPDHGGTPGKINDLRQPGRQRLNGKLRVSNHPLRISYNAGRRLIWLAGYFRPIVGAIFGLVFYVLINAGLLQVLVAPHELGSRAFFIAAVCFAAGFSEVISAK